MHKFQATKRWYEQALAEEAGHDISAGPAKLHPPQKESHMFSWIFNRARKAEREKCKQVALNYASEISPGDFQCIKNAAEEIAKRITALK